MPRIGGREVVEGVDWDQNTFNSHGAGLKQRRTEENWVFFHCVN